MEQYKSEYRHDTLRLLIIAIAIVAVTASLSTCSVMKSAMDNDRLARFAGAGMKPVEIACLEYGNSAFGAMNCQAITLTNLPAGEVAR